MRLIDADDFFLEMENSTDLCAEMEIDGLKALKKYLDMQPTAYDVDKVVEQLDDLKDQNVCRNISCLLCKYTGKCMKGEMSDKVALDRAIKIVKGENHETEEDR